MPDDRRTRRRRLDPTKSNAVVASAAVLNSTKMQRLPSTEEWAEDAWGFYDSVPEVRFACGWLANAMSRCRLAAARRGQAGDEPIVAFDGAAADAIEAFAGGTQGQSQLLAAATTHLTVPGIGYLVGEPNGALDVDGAPIAPGETWQVVSADELVLVPDGQSNRYGVKVGEGTRDVRLLAPDALAVRLWRQHRRWAWRPDSPIRACLTVLRELEALTQHIDAAVVSRLAGAGILVLPNDLTFPASATAGADEDPFVAELIQSMMTPIADRDAASAVVPLVIRVPPAAVDQIKHLSFATPLDEKAQALRDEALRRFAAGMDLPAEVIMGLGDSNHWTAWQIEESALKLHIEPMLEAICHGLTVGYLHPYLRAAGQDPTDYIVWYDTSELTVRPDRSGDAKDLYDRQAINVAALRRETGFGDEDAPSDDDLKRAILIDLVKGAPTLAPVLLPVIGIEIDIPDDAEPLPTGGAPAPAPPADDTAPPGPPQTRDDEPSQEAALVAASDAIVWRALERAGARIVAAARRARVDWSPNGTDHAYVHTVAPVEVNPDTLLDGAWGRVPEVAARYGVDPVALTATLDAYTRRLLTTGSPHSFDRLTEAIGA